MAAQIRISQLHEDVMKVIRGKGVFDVDIEIPLVTPGYYTLATAIAAAVTEIPTIIKFSISATKREVWYFQLEHTFTNSDYTNTANWSQLLTSTEGVDGNDVSIKMRRGYESVLNAITQPPNPGEFIVVLNPDNSVKGVKIGDGSTTIASLAFIGKEITTAWSATLTDDKVPTELLVGTTFSILKVDGGDNWT